MIDRFTKIHCSYLQEDYRDKISRDFEATLDDSAERVQLSIELDIKDVKKETDLIKREAILIN